MNEGMSLRELILGYGAQLVIFLIPALLVLWLLRRRWLVHLDTAGFPVTTAWRQALLGAGTALAALVIALLPGILTGAYFPNSSWQPTPRLLVGTFSMGPAWQPYSYELAADPTASAGGLVLFFGIQSLFEEALFRAIGLALLAMLLLWLAEFLWLDPAQRRFGKREHEQQSALELAWRRRAWAYAGMLATLALSIGFGLMHRHNPQFSPLALLNIVLAGIWLGLLFWKRISLLAAWLAHFAWNAGLALLGLPISGFAMLPDPLGIGFGGARPSLLTGGAFGPEASLPCTFAFAGLSAWLAWRMLQQARASASSGDLPTSVDSDSAERQAG